MKILKHIARILRHKRWVWYYCKLAGIRWRGFKHDLSKFSPTEFWESVYYYTPDESPIQVAKYEQGYSEAWLHHKGRNKHHYEYWIDDFDDGGKPIKMPYKDAMEMICDWLAAAHVYGERFSYRHEYKWWRDQVDRGIAMHPDTISFVDIVLYRTTQFGNYALRKQYTKKIYGYVEHHHEVEQDEWE